MTLRELIEYIYDNDLDTDLYTSIYNNYYTSADATLPDVIECYNLVVQEIVELPQFQNSDHHILLESVVDSDSTRVDVCLFDTAEGKSYSVDYIDWSELVDLLVEDRVGLCHYDRLAHVLWELTFHGFTRDAIRESALELEKASEELSESFDLDDLDSI